MDAEEHISHIVSLPTALCFFKCQILRELMWVMMSCDCAMANVTGKTEIH